MNIQLEESEYFGVNDKGASYSWVKQIHTLGPAGTNCEKAALKWVTQKCPNAHLHLHPTMEQAATRVANCRNSALLSVMAYPLLHAIIYEHITALQLIDVFIMNTDNMVLASASGQMPTTCATHPAPEKLLPETVKRHYVASNVVAAMECANGKAEGCITTLGAAQQHSLKILQKFGPVPMGFTIHGPLEARQGKSLHTTSISNTK